ncbi:MAG: regulator of sigma protease [Pyrinomonadaceae bacterium]|jgi:regulator of sigma E protease|nr:regulator of sigma protease [Pyrinomonadaceae bacterium]MDQ1728329.1 regulator of sigma protease [Pyrinomonadaceae bacterium]
MTIVTGIFAFIFILGAAVVLHEFGHFIVAKLFKIRVETFSVGFGPRLFGKKWGHTDYRVSAIPLGGYVKLGGDESNAPIEGEGAADIPAHERFDLRPRWQRVLVAIAGPVMNVITAISIPLAGALMYGIPATPAPIVSSIAAGGASEKAGLQRGDRIVAFNGIEHPKWDTIRGDALLSPGQPLPVVVERNGQRVPLQITPVPRTEDGETAGLLDFLPDYGDLPVVVREVTPNSPAAEAGMQPGDQVLTIAGQKVRSAEQVTQYIAEHKGEPITLRLQRQGQQRDLTATARKLSDGKERLGFGPAEDVPFVPVGIGAGLRYAVDTNLEILRLTGKALGQFFTGQRSARNTLSGPVGIYKAASSSVERYGWGGLFTTLAFLSLNLGIFNLLPIPVLDGGAIFLLLIEGALATIGMTLSLRVRDRIQQVGFVMVLLLMVFVITNDVLKTFTRGSDNSAPAATTPGK